MSRPAPTSEFREWLMNIPDLISLMREYDVTITCPNPGTEHGRKLLATLGVEIKEKP